MSLDSDAQSDLGISAEEAENVLGGRKTSVKRSKRGAENHRVPADQDIVVKMPPLPAVADDDTPDPNDYDPYGSSS